MPDKPKVLPNSRFLAVQTVKERTIIITYFWSIRQALPNFLPDSLRLTPAKRASFGLALVRVPPREIPVETWEGLRFGLAPVGLPPGEIGAAPEHHPGADAALVVVNALRGPGADVGGDCFPDGWG